MASDDWRDGTGLYGPGLQPKARSRNLSGSEGMQNPPYKARVGFYMVYYSPADDSEIKRALYTANFVFVFKTNVQSELIPIKPLGLAITYFREDEAFK